MSIRYKFFWAFSVVVALACGLAFYGIRGISTTGDLVVRLYDGPLMGINHARSAHASLNEARLILQRSLSEGAPKETLAKYEKILADIAEDLTIVRERVKNENVTVALQRAESQLLDWADAGLKILKPPSGGLTMVPAPFSIQQKSDDAVSALDDLVEMVAAYGFDYRIQAESTVAAARTTMLALAIGTALIGLALAVAFAVSMSRPIFAAMRVAERVAAGNLTDRIEVRRHDELGRLLKSLLAMQGSLKVRADQDHALMVSKEQLARMLAALSATNEAIMKSKTRIQLFELVCQAASKGSEFTSTTIAMVKPDNDFLDIVASAGPTAETTRNIKLSINEVHPEGRGLSGTAFRTRQACISNDYLADRRGSAFHALARSDGARSGAAFPLFSSDQVTGAMLFISAELDAFTPEVVELLRRLTDNVSFALTNFDRADEKTRADERIEYLATHDSLTGLPNREMFNQLLHFTIEASQRFGRRFALLFIDLDRFKVINDSLGHEAGDALLIEIGNRLRGSLRSSDVVARLGGDEFVLILGDILEIKDVENVAHKLLSTLSRSMQLCGHECHVTASIGIAMFPADGSDIQTLTKNADMAMYLAKEDGKNAFRFFSEKVKTQSIERLMLETALRHAIERNQFTLHYQPKVVLATGLITGVEALLRWAHPDLGMLAPMQFIPLAEENGLIVPIGRWVLTEACTQNMAWQRQGVPPVSMAVNLSPRQFFDEDLLQYIDDALAESGMPATQLQLEVTESMVMRDVPRAVKLLDAIQSRGIRLAIDDFGTGYSSMSLMKQFPIDTIKIDRSFVRDLPIDSEDQAIAQAIISMGKALGMTVIAEGVETAEQETFLRDHACDEVQGFLFSKPVPPGQMADLFGLAPTVSPSLQPEPFATDKMPAERLMLTATAT